MFILNKYSFLDNWVTPVPIPDQPSIPVQVKAEYKYRDSSKPEKIGYYVVTQYRPGLLVRPQDYYVNIKIF